MKLRLYQNSIRMRTQIPEVEAIIATGVIEAFVQFGPNESDRLTYKVKFDDSSALNIEFHDREIIMHVPEATGRQWAESDEVGVYGSQDLGDGKTLRILLEKDFKCLDNTDEDQSMMYPNPRQA